MGSRVSAVVRCFVRWLGRRKWIGSVGPVVRWVDRLLYRYTAGRWTLVRVAGLPSLILTVRGRRSGEPRMTPLLYVPHGDDYIVTGSNWGGRTHPTWTGNLLANPDATVNVRGVVQPVVARLLTGAERDEIWSGLTSQWPAYELYEARSGRELRIFRLTRR